MSIIWFVMWLLGGTPDLFNHTGSDSTWLMWLIAAFAVDINVSSRA